MAMQSNCPNCGAPIDNDICPYCGTAHNLPPTTMEIGSIVPIRIEHKGHVFEFDLCIETFAANDMGPIYDIYSDGIRFSTMHSPEWHVAMSGRVVSRKR